MINIIVCVDNDMGMAFNSRRQSQDRILRHKILELAESRGGRLWMNSYSAGQFSSETSSAIFADDAFLNLAGDKDYCFVENLSLLPYADKIITIILCRWNKRYPSDLKFGIGLTDGLWEKQILEEFPGSSHEKITIEEWKKLCTDK